MKRTRHGPPAPPIKAVKRGEKTQIGVIVSYPIRKLIVESAKATGRSISREAEIMIERCANYDRVIENTRKTLADFDKGNHEAALRRAGYTPVYQPDGTKLWAEPGAVPPSGFEGWTPGEMEASLEAAAAQREAAGVTAEEIERRNAEALRRSEIGEVFDVPALRERIAKIEAEAAEPPKTGDESKKTA
jgi:hypothetical protein